MERRILAATLALAALIAVLHLDRAEGLVVDAEPWVAMDPPYDAAEKLILDGDGQFFSMLARDPTLARPEALRVGDPPSSFAYRAMRPGFGWAGFVASAGQPGAVAWALVGLTVASVGLLAVAVMDLARAAGRRVDLAALVIAIPGVLHLLSWTGPEIAAAACACLGVAAALRNQQRRSAGWLVAAVLLRETLLLVVGALVLARLLRWWAVPPPVVLGLWLLVVRLRVGAWPGGESRFELGGILSAMDTWDRNAVLSLALLALLVVIACTHYPRVAIPLLGLHVLLGAVMDENVWTADGFPRVLLPLYAILLALAGPVNSADASRPPVTS